MSQNGLDMALRDVPVIGQFFDRDVSSSVLFPDCFFGRLSERLTLVTERLHQTPESTDWNRLTASVLPHQTFTFWVGRSIPELTDNVTLLQISEDLLIPPVPEIDWHCILRMIAVDRKDPDQSFFLKVIFSFHISLH